MQYHGFKYILPFHADPAGNITKNTDGRAQSVALLPANPAGKLN